MQEHVHTGVISFLFAGISAVIFFQLIRLTSAHMVEAGGRWEGAGRSLGALVEF